MSQDSPSVPCPHCCTLSPRNAAMVCHNCGDNLHSPSCECNLCTRAEAVTGQVDFTWRTPRRRLSLA